MTVSAGELRDLAAAVLSAAGIPGTDADLVADSLVTADLWGHQSHGVMRLGWYLDRIISGVMRPVTVRETISDTGPVAVVDGHDGVGQVLAAFAAKDAVRRARMYGVGVVGVRNSNHFGTAAYFTRMAAAEGCIGILTTNSSPAMAPWFGREKLIGANPWSIAAPGGRHGALVVDVSNTLVARGKIYLARQLGENIPSGWALDAAGAPTVDPVAAIAGSLLPMGGHKGYAIAVMMDVLSGVLTGSESGARVSGPYQADLRSGCGHLFVALDIAAFHPDRSEYESRIEHLIASIKAAATSEAAAEILLPGEIEVRNAQRHRRRGLNLPRKTLEELAKRAESAGVPFRLSSGGAG